jgi:hypothetical protein
MLSDDEWERFGEKARFDGGTVAAVRVEKILSNESSTSSGNLLKSLDGARDGIVS